MLKELKKNKMSVVATGILFGVMGVLIIPMIAVIVKISNALSQKHPRIYKYSMIAFIGMLLAISLFCVVIKHQMSFLVIVACLALLKTDNKWSTTMEISDLIKSARIEKGLTQQQLADVVFVTRQTISKWELGKSVPDQASLILLYQYLDIKDNEKKQLSKLIFNKQNIILILIAILFSPMVIGVRFICCKIDKIENRKIKAVIKVIGFVVFSSYLVSLKENVAYLLIGIFSLVYLLYQFYLSGLETK
jgi:transcriptional regulator with XRE-family HTH domain